MKNDTSGKRPKSTDVTPKPVDDETTLPRKLGVGAGILLAGAAGTIGVRATMQSSEVGPPLPVAQSTNSDDGKPVRIETGPLRETYQGPMMESEVHLPASAVPLDAKPQSLKQGSAPKPLTQGGYTG